MSTSMGGKKIHQMTDYRDKEPIDDFKPFFHKQDFGPGLVLLGTIDRLAIEERCQDVSVVDCMRAMMEVVYRSDIEDDIDFSIIKAVTDRTWVTKSLVIESPHSDAAAMFRQHAQDILLVEDVMDSDEYMETMDRRGLSSIAELSPAEWSQVPGFGPALPD
ncbi:MAG: hypothetical protein Q9208_001841 [Pyrenodesmia sp. 3 TL-2023]